MDGVRTFLESSTIHGLTYISTTKRVVKLFWLLTVFSGFTTAGYLINLSFQNWNQNPVSTTTETLPIREVMFPKVTVCPPKKTLTDLNYDIEALGNMTLDIDVSNQKHQDTKIFNQLLSNFAEHFQQKDFEDAFYNKLMNFKEKEKYRNWYKGITKIPLRVEYYQREHYTMATNYDVRVDDTSIETNSEAGNVSTPFFGEKFDADNFVLQTEFTVSIVSPYYDPHKPHSLTWTRLTIFLTYDIENNYGSNLKINCDKDNYYSNATFLNKTMHEYSQKRIVSEKCDIKYTRYIPQMYFEDLKKKRFTGFSVRWEFDNNIIANKYTYTGKATSKFFIKTANLVHAGRLLKEDIMPFVRQTKTENKNKVHSFDSTQDAINSFGDIFDTIGNNFNKTLWRISKPLFEHDISDQSLETAAEIFIYIMAPPDQNWLNWYRVYEEWMIRISSLRRLLGKPD